jgi:hypothetical protein
VGTAVLVLRDRGAEPVVGPDAVGRLAALGITRISLLQDGCETGVFLEGWAFDTAQARVAAAVVFPGRHEDIRILREIESVAVARHVTGVATKQADENELCTGSATAEGEMS